MPVVNAPDKLVRKIFKKSFVEGLEKIQHCSDEVISDYCKYPKKREEILIEYAKNPTKN